MKARRLAVHWTLSQVLMAVVFAVQTPAQQPASLHTELLAEVRLLRRRGD